MTFIAHAPYPHMFPGKERWHVNEEILDFSPYIAFNCISLTNVFLIVKMYRERESGTGKNEKSFGNFCKSGSTRAHWTTV